MPPVHDDAGPPYPDPVQFDHRLADAAAEALRDAVGQLRQAMSADVPLGNTALASWKGAHAEQFRATFGEQQRRTVPQLIDDLLTWAKRIDDASAAATALQAQHDRANQRWRDER
jgi:hypothetical protein